MKLSEAPRAGWYPDPEGGSRLRWWDGGDWTERYTLRRPETQPAAPQSPSAADVEAGAQAWSQPGNMASQIPAQTAAVVEQVRMAARAEAERAAADFERRARAVTGSIPPLISQYTNKFMRLVKVAMALAFVFVVLWFVYQVFVSKSLFDWVGDRIDNITDQESGASAFGPS